MESKIFKIYEELDKSNHPYNHKEVAKEYLRKVMDAIKEYSNWMNLYSRAKKHFDMNRIKELNKDRKTLDQINAIKVEEPENYVSWRDDLKIS